MKMKEPRTCSRCEKTTPHTVMIERTYVIFLCNTCGKQVVHVIKDKDKRGYPYNDR